MRRQFLGVVLLSLLCVPALGYATVETFTAAGASTWTAPAGVTVVQVECWGGGGGGSNAVTTNNTGRGGAGGGGYAIRTAMAVTPTTVYNYTVGAGGISTATDSTLNGGDSTFTGNAGVQCIGKGATGVAVSTTTATAGATGSTGDTTHDGGAGANGVTTTAGGGGEGAATGANGNAASGSAGGTGTDGGNGGAAGTCSSGGGAVGAVGTQPGGGGAGGCRGSSSRAGGNGGAGQIRLTYTAVTSSNQYPRGQ